MKTVLRRVCTQLRTLDRMSYQEIADRTGVKKSTVASWLRGTPLPPDDLREKMRRGGKRGGKVTKPPLECHSLAKLAKGRQLTKEAKGRIAEAAVLSRLYLFDFEVYGGLSGKEQTDWIVAALGSERLIRLQVRWAGPQKEGRPGIRLRKSDGRHQTTRMENFDFLAGYSLENDTAYVFSYGELSRCKALITVREDAAERWEKLRKE